MASRSSSDGFPPWGGKESWASLKRRVIALGVILVDCRFYLALEAGRGP